MAKRRPTAGGQRQDPETGQIDGYNHRDHKPRDFRRKTWHSKHTADKGREQKEQLHWWSDVARNFGWSRPNRRMGIRRNP